MDGCLVGALLADTVYFNFYSWWLSLWRSCGGHGLPQFFQLVVASLALSSRTWSTSTFAVGGGFLALSSQTRSTSTFTVGGCLFDTLVVDTVSFNFYSCGCLCSGGGLALFGAYFAVRIEADKFWLALWNLSTVGGCLFGALTSTFPVGGCLFSALVADTVYVSFHSWW